MESSNQLDTYNRVRELQSPLVRSLLIAIHLTLALVTVASAVWWFIIENRGLAAAIFIIAITLLTIVFLKSRNRRLSCRYCDNELINITRPMILTPRFLAIHGMRHGDYFFTQRRGIDTLFNKQWIKISNRSLACHHCRLTEERQHEHCEPVSQIEVETIKNDRQNDTRQT